MYATFSFGQLLIPDLAQAQRDGHAEDHEEDCDHEVHHCTSTPTRCRTQLRDELLERLAQRATALPGALPDHVEDLVLADAVPLVDALQCVHGDLLFELVDDRADAARDLGVQPGRRFGLLLFLCHRVTARPHAKGV